MENHSLTNIPGKKIETETAKRLKAKKRKGQFIKGPIPLPWISQASKLPGKALHVGLSLWYMSGLQKSNKIKLTSKVYTDKFGVSRQAMYRALPQLEQAGLIAVERRQGKAFKVTVLEITSSTDEDTATITVKPMSVFEGG